MTPLAETGLALAFIVVFPAAMWAAPRVRARVVGPVVQQRHDAALEVWKLLGPLTGVFLIFLLVQGMSYFRDAEVAVAREAGNAMQLDRALAGVAPAQGGPARVLVREYVRTLIRDEWPAMRRGREGAQATAAALLVQDAVSGLVQADPERAARHEVQKMLNDVEDDRAGRTGTAGGSLPRGMWWVGGGLFVLLLATVSQLHADHMLSRLAWLHGAGLAMLAALLFLMDGPYKGVVSVSPAPLERALAVMVSRG